MTFTINKDLLPMKGHYFLFNAGIAPVQPFMPVIAKNLNFSTSAVGTITGILPFSGMVAKPIFGAIADRFRLHKALFLCFQVLIIVGFFNIQFLKGMEKNLEGHVKLVCGAETNFHICFSPHNKHGHCLVEDILEDSRSNKTIKCFLRCKLSPQLRTELCGPWKADPKICSEAFSSNDNVGEYSHSRKRDDGSYEITNQVYPAKVLDDAKLEFEASVPLVHSVLVGSCMYFRVADALLNDETHHVPYCLNETDTLCQIQCHDDEVSDLLKMQDNTKENLEYWRYHQFWVFLGLWVLAWMGMAVVGVIADAVCFNLLGERASEYGKQRLWGSMGWGSFSIFSGWVIDRFVKHHKVDYTPVFYIMLVVLFFDIVASYNLKYEQTKITSHLFRNVGGLFKDLWVCVFFIWCIVIGMCAGVQWTFLYWHLDDLTTCDQRGNERTLLGLVGGIQSFLGEMPSFFLFSWIVKKIGHLNLMTFIPFLVGIRFILYSILENPWWTLPIELLQSSMGLTFAVMASYASIVAPPGADATVQGLVGAIFEGIGVSVGSYLGGILYKIYTGAGLFQIFSVVAFTLSLGHGLLYYVLGNNSKRQNRAKETASGEGSASDISKETTHSVKTKNSTE